MNKRLLISASLALLAACGARRIPGTDIDDTDDTRAILQVMEKYRSAVEARDIESGIGKIARSQSAGLIATTGAAVTGAMGVVVAGFVVPVSVI